MLKEFKEFALRGNVLDMAVGIILGASFGNVVTSFVRDVMSPVLGLVTGQIDFSNLYINLSTQSYSSLAQAQEAGAPLIVYGQFFNAVFDFIIAAFVIFLFVHQVNRFKRQEEPVTAATQTCPYCRSTIDAEASRCPNCTSEI